MFTDHSTCVSVLNSARPTGKLKRWALTIHELNLIIKHRAGKLNISADALSHNPSIVTRAVGENSCEVENLSAHACPKVVYTYHA